MSNSSHGLWDVKIQDDRFFISTILIHLESETLGCYQSVSHVYLFYVAQFVIAPLILQWRKVCYTPHWRMLNVSSFHQVMCTSSWCTSPSSFRICPLSRFKAFVKSSMSLSTWIEIKIVFLSRHQIPNVQMIVSNLRFPRPHQSRHPPWTKWQQSWHLPYCLLWLSSAG